MSAISSLYSGDQEIPSWTNYEDGEALQFEANYLVPMVWFALFSRNDLCVYVDPDGECENPDDNRVPMLVRKKADCLSALEERTDFLKKIASNCEGSVEKLRLRLVAAEGEYISLDMSEVYYMDGESAKFLSEVKSILKLFDEQSPEHMSSLLGMICAEGYDLESYDYVPNEDYGYEYHAIGLCP